MSVKHQAYALIGDSYYGINETEHIVIPDNADYKSPALQMTMHPETNLCEIDLYRHHSDLVTDRNSERVAFMKDLIINENIQNIDYMNDDYVLGIDYDLFNKEGCSVKSGTASIQARNCSAVINHEITEDNMLKYRKAMVFDGRIEICIPEISRYGIRNCNQYPYTLRINSIFLKSSLVKKCPGDCRTQVDCSRHHASSAQYRCYNPCELSKTNFASHFLTNAHIGTTIIDQMVVPKKLVIPDKAEEITMCEIPIGELGKGQTVKIDDKIGLIVVNVEVLFDNMNVVYDAKDIEELLRINRGDEEDPDIEGDPSTPIVPEYPDHNCHHHHNHDHCYHECDCGCHDKPENPDDDKKDDQSTPIIPDDYEKPTDPDDGSGTENPSDGNEPETPGDENETENPGDTGEGTEPKDPNEGEITGDNTGGGEQTGGTGSEETGEPGNENTDENQEITEGTSQLEGTNENDSL